MKDEDADWLVYHHIAQKDSITPEDLISATGLDPAIVGASLERLDQSMLIERSGETVRALDIAEAILKCQLKNTEDPRFEIVDGVIKIRKG